MNKKICICARDMQADNDIAHERVFENMVNIKIIFFKKIIFNIIISK